MIVMIDNYDSFTYNLVQYLEEIGAEINVFRNDAVDIPGLEALSPSGLVISPGPGRPDEAGISIDAIHAFTGKIPILGVCLGHQAIGRAFGGEIVSARNLMHGKTSSVTTDGLTIYDRIKSPFTAMRYHSLAISRASLPDVLQITAEADDGEIMGVRHKEHPTEGIQFHPESIMTSVGKRLLRNFYERTNGMLA
ncbi:MAG: aminodeoxychorismate/anthranilate synthase component II [Deltaproteobacteria bacterium]|jgi:anthranilate synthase/aminodeoxychorismate synthase-like glutamine amidotransferase|nr:aminodeoxychorismate/anthranilate synthase component II [Deltaproteobacteria bacterium]